MSPRPTSKERSSTATRPTEAHGEMLNGQDWIVLPSGQSFNPPQRDQPDTGLLLSLRNTEGARLETMPRGFQIMIPTISRPKTSMRKIFQITEDLEAANHDEGGDDNTQLAAQTTQNHDGQNNRRFHEGETFPEK